MHPDERFLFQMARLAGGVENMAKTLSDIESRVRRLERFQWLVMGGAATIGAVVSFLLGHG